MSNTASPSIAEERTSERLLFYINNMSPPSNQYVCWIDVMGSQGVMLRSLNVASNFLLKLHIAALRAHDEFPVDLYPVIDGLYACSPSQRQILSFINRVYSMLAVTFILEQNQLYKFQVRSGLAFGPVVTGKQVLEYAQDLQNHPEHTNSLFLGSPLTQAYQAEKKSSPFGVALHESARTFAPSGETVLSGSYIKWWKIFSRQNDDLLALQLYASLKQHYVWCSAHTVALSYDKQDIERHQAIADEYFSE